MMSAGAVEMLVVQMVREMVNKGNTGEELQVSLFDHFWDDLRLDSVDIAQLLCDIEDDFKISIPEVTAARLPNVRSLVAFVQEAVAAKQAQESV